MSICTFKMRQRHLALTIFTFLNIAVLNVIIVATIIIKT